MIREQVLGQPRPVPAELVQQIATISHPLEHKADLDPLMARIGDARLVLLGEASHGTSEYYIWRARLSQRLIQEKGFSFIAVEGDWPDCYRVNRYVKGYDGAGESAYDVLHAFERWPTWMWANWEIAGLAEWLRRYNQGRPNGEKAGFYGLDVYSLHESMDAVIEYLTQHAPEALAAAHRAYSCLEPYGEDVQQYAWSTALVPEDCEDEVIDLLVTVRRQAEQFPGDPEAAFNAEQNAWVVVEAERYYRAMVRTNAGSWNVRDTHMADALDRLLAHHGPQSKGIVWAHNTHIGDARATDMARVGMVNLGQIARERHASAGVVLVGFGSQRGSVIAADAWGAPLQIMDVPQARTGSWEELLHRPGVRNKLLLTDDLRQQEDARRPRGHRAIGVVYQPEREGGNYVPTDLPGRYDAFLFLDETEALHPLHIEPDGSQPPATYPWGL